MLLQRSLACTPCYMSGTKARMLGAAPNEQPAMAFPWGFEPEGFA